MAIKFVTRAPVVRRPLNSFTDALIGYKRGSLNLTEAKVFIEKGARKFAEPSEDELKEMRKAWGKYAPEKAKGLYLK